MISFFRRKKVEPQPTVLFKSVGHKILTNAPSRIREECIKPPLRISSHPSCEPFRYLFLFSEGRRNIMVWEGPDTFDFLEPDTCGLTEEGKPFEQLLTSIFEEIARRTAEYEAEVERQKQRDLEYYKSVLLNQEARDTNTK